MLRLYVATSHVKHAAIDALRRLRGDTSGVTAIEYGLIAGALAVAAVSDLIPYEIPNSVCLALIAGFALMAPALPAAVIGAHVATAAAVFAATALAFAFGILGGGDAKLLAATALWMGWRNL